MRFVNVRRAAGITDQAPISLEPQLELWDPTDPAENTDHEPQEVLR
jgi:hypothetical protein